MSLLSSLYSGASGLEASSLDLSTIGDNISNANTIGFKGSRAVFEDALSQSMVSGSSYTSQLGLGTKLEAIQRLLTQGALTNTGVATDLAVDGNGFFVVNGTHGGTTGTFYTRAGQFTLNSDGYLVNLDGLRVQGYSADAAGQIQPTLGDLDVGDANAQPQVTSNVTIRGNLQSDKPIIIQSFDTLDPANTSTFATSTTVYDSLGTAHQVSVYFRHNAAGSWDWHAVTDGGGVQGGTAGVPAEIATGALNFDTSGRLTDSSQSSSFSPLGAASQPLNFNLGTGTNSGGTGLDGMTQTANKSTVTFLDQDGFAGGTLSSISINTEGRITGVFSNGQSRALGQVAVAGFPAADKLNRLGGNLLQVTPDSGDPVVGVAGLGGRGSIVAGSLEQSNVDMATEFVRMISAQRAFQANSKTISTADALLAELMSLKR